jgi:glutamine synthetase
MQSANDVLALIRDKGIVTVDLWFTDDSCGRQQHITIPSEVVDENLFSEGLSSKSRFRGWARIWEYDLRIVPIPETAFIDPFRKLPSLVLLCELFVPEIPWPYTREPRYVARMAVTYLRQSKITDDR